MPHVVSRLVTLECGEELCVCPSCGKSISSIDIPAGASVSHLCRSEPKNHCLAGTQLEAILAGPPFWIVKNEGCLCESRARMMDSWGCDECERRVDEIVSWLREEAEKRGLPFFDAAGRMLVAESIRRARREQERRR